MVPNQQCRTKTVALTQKQQQAPMYHEPWMDGTQYLKTGSVILRASFPICSGKTPNPVCVEKKSLVDPALGLFLELSANFHIKISSIDSPLSLYNYLLKKCLSCEHCFLWWTHDVQKKTQDFGRKGAEPQCEVHSNCTPKWLKPCNDLGKNLLRSGEVDVHTRPANESTNGRNSVTRDMPRI